VSSVKFFFYQNHIRSIIFINFADWRSLVETTRCESIFNFVVKTTKYARCKFSWKSVLAQWLGYTTKRNLPPPKNTVNLIVIDSHFGWGIWKTLLMVENSLHCLSSRMIKKTAEPFSRMLRASRRWRDFEIHSFSSIIKQVHFHWLAYQMF